MCRPVLAVLVLSLAAVSLAFSSPEFVRAQTLDVDAELALLVLRSETVVLGRITRVEGFTAGPHGEPGIHSRVELVADEVCQGVAVSVFRFWVQGGVVGHRARTLVGQARFEPGERALVFLSRADGGDLWPTGMARGKWAIRYERGQERVLPVQDGHGDASGPSMPLEDVLDRIRRLRGSR